MGDSDNENVGGAPLPPARNRTKPTVIRPVSKAPTDGNNDKPAIQAPHRPAPPVARPPPPVQRPSDPVKTVKTEPEHQPTLPSGNGSRNSVKVKPAVAATGKRKLEITVVDARPMSEIGFRDLKGGGTVSTPVSAATTGTGSDAIKAVNSDAPVAPPCERVAPPKPQRPAMYKPQQQAQGTGKSPHNDDPVPPPKPARPSMIIPASSQQEDTKALDANANLSAVPPRPARPTIIRPQSNVQTTPDHSSAESPTPPSRPKPPLPASAPSIQAAHVTTATAAPVPRARSSRASDADNSTAADKKVSPVPSPRPRNKITSSTDSEVQPSPEAKTEITVTSPDVPAKPPPKPLPSSLEPPPRPKRPSASPTAVHKTPTHLPSKDTDTSPPHKADQYVDTTPIYAKISKPTHPEPVHEASPAEPPFKVKLKPTVPTEDTRTNGVSISPESKGDPTSLSEESQVILRTKGRNSISNDEPDESPPPIKPKPISGAFLAKFEQTEEHSRNPPVPAKRPVTMIAHTEQSQKVSESSAPTVAPKRPITIIGGPHKSQAKPTADTPTETQTGNSHEDISGSISKQSPTSKQPPVTPTSHGSAIPNKPLDHPASENVSSNFSSEAEIGQQKTDSYTFHEETPLVKPATAPAKPATAPVRPTETPGRPATGPVKPGNVPVKPETSVKPREALPVNPPESLPVKPQTAAAQPETAPVKPSTAPAKPATGPVKPSTEQKLTKQLKLPPRPSPGHPLYHYMLPYPHGVALHGYTAHQPDEISFKAGETILLVRKEDEHWLVGKCGDQEGLFPANFIEVKREIPVEGAQGASWKDALEDWPISVDENKTDGDTVRGPRCRARFDFEGDGEGELALEDGDVVQLQSRVGTEWLRGEVRGRQGIFPSSFVEIIEDLPADGCVGEDVFSAQGTAIFDFDGEEGELTFQAGDTINILNLINVEWLYGECHGKKGQFPASFVSHVPPNLPVMKQSGAAVKTRENLPGKKGEGQTGSQPLPRKPEEKQEEKVKEEEVEGPVFVLKSKETTLGYCRGISDYLDPPLGDLPFKVGDRIEILEFVGEDWARGRLGKKEGMFPLRCVAEEVIDPDHVEPVPEPVVKEKLYGRVIHDFNGENDDDLTIKEGDVVEMEEIADTRGNWRWGRLNGKRGMFPVIFVEAL